MRRAVANHDGRMRPKQVRISATCSLPPELVLAAACDFSARRAEIWPNVPAKLMTVHGVGPASADVTEGTRKGLLFAWERCDYDWSAPGCVTATVTDSNVYASPGSRWEIRAEATPEGSIVEMIWVRRFKRTPMGVLLGTMYRAAGARLFRHDVEVTLRNMDAASDPGSLTTRRG